MQLTATQLIDRINKKIRNAKAALGGDSELYKLLDEANVKLKLKVDLISAKRRGAPFLVFNGIYEYAVDEDLDYNKMIMLRYENEEEYLVKSQFEVSPGKYLFNSRNPMPDDSSNFVFGENSKYINNIPRIEVAAIEFLNSTPYLKLKVTETLNSTTLVNCDSYNGNGEWVASGDATNVSTDTARYKEGSGSVSFDSSGSSTSVVLTNSTFTAVDLTDYENISKLFCYVKLPSTIPTSITLKFGSDASNYHTKTITTAQNGIAFQQGWNLLGFDWETSTSVGTPDLENITYLQLTITNSTAVAQTGYHVDYFTARIGKECSLDFYSKYLVKNVSGVRQERFLTGDDSTILEGEESSLLIDEATILAHQNLRELKDAEMKTVLHNANTEKLHSEYPSEKEHTSQTYYNL